MISARRLSPRAQLTRRPLPDTDPSIELLTADEREIAAAVWHGRSEAELRASGSFGVIARTLVVAGAPAELIDLARRAIADERRHAEICWRVACAFAGEQLPAPRRLLVTVPALERARPELRHILHVVGMCCLNETSGSAFLELCRAGVQAPLAKAALHELSCDEIDHARLGWAFVASRIGDGDLRAELGAWLPELLADNLAAWRNRPKRPITDALIAHGCPRWADVDAAVLGAAEELVIPGFEQLGVDVTAARSWLATA